MGQETVEQLVRGHVQIGEAEQVKAVLQLEVTARPVTRLEWSVGVEDQSVPRVDRERRCLHLGVQAQWCRVHGRSHGLQAAVRGQPQRPAGARR